MEKIRNLSISKKWILTICTLCLFATIIILMLMTGLKNSIYDLREFEKDKYEVEQLVKNNTINILLTAKDIRDIYIQSEEGKALNTELRTRLEENINTIQENTSRLSEILDSSTMPVNEYISSINRWLGIGVKILEDTYSGNKDAARKALAEDCLREIETVISLSNQISSVISDSVTMSIDTNIRSNRFIIFFSIGFFFIGIIVSSIMSSKMRKSLLTAIKEMQFILENMKKGNYDINIDYNSKDEMGVLINHMEDMISSTKVVLDDTSDILTDISKGNLRNKPKANYVGIFKMIEDSIRQIIEQMSGMLLQITDSAKEVKHNAEEVADNVAKLTEKVLEQDKIIDTFVEATDQVKINIIQNKQFVEKTNDISILTKEQANEGSEMMDKMLESMSEISQSSKDISEIINIIDSIAEQTNLLALNAAIEAARAGEFGKGFAVVAGEIRELAYKSSESVKDIHKIVETSLISVKNGEKIVEETVQVLNNVVSSIEKTTLVSMELKSNTNQQEELFEQLVDKSKELRKALEGNTLIAQENLGISQNLAHQADRLTQHMEKFQVN